MKRPLGCILLGWLLLAASPAQAFLPAGQKDLAPVEEIVREVAADSGYFDLDFQVAPGQVATVASTDLAPPRMVIGSPSADAQDPFSASTSRLFRMVANQQYHDRLLHVELDGGGAGVDLYVGRDSNGNRAPDVAEVMCKLTDAGPADHCALKAFDNNHWVMAHRRSGATTELNLRWYYMYYAYVERDEAGDMQENAARVSAPGRSDAQGRFPVRFAYPNSGMAPGDVRLARVRVTSGGQVTERLLRVVRTGTTQVQTNPLLAEVLGPTTVRLAPGEAHREIAVVLPGGSREVYLYMDQVGQGSVGFWVRPIEDSWSGPRLPPAPPPADPGSYAASRDPSVPNRMSIGFVGPLPSLWYATPVNYSAYPITVKLGAQLGFEPELPPVVKSGSYYNPERGGHGAFIYRAGTTPVMLWYTYDTQGDPTWYYAQGSHTGLMTPMKLYRAAWLGDRQRLYPVGLVSLRADTAGSLVFDYEIDGERGVEILSPFLAGCPQVAGAPLDASGHWFDPAFAGTGYSVQVHPNYEFISAFVYDELGRPRFLVAERGGAFDADDDTLVLEQLQGFSPLGEHVAPIRNPVGLLQRRYQDGRLAEVSIDAEFSGTIPGAWDSLHAVQPLSATQGCDP